MVSEERVRKAAYERAVVWAKGEYTDTSRAYREGMREPLAVPPVSPPPSDGEP